GLAEAPAPRPEAPAVLPVPPGPAALAMPTPGKMLRPILCLLSCQAIGGDWRRALPAATALELLHNFSLVHDDIQDRSSIRHHRPTVWQMWGEGQAINVGDAFFALAHLAAEALGERGVGPADILGVLALLDRAALALCEGQVSDLAYEERTEVTLEEYLAMVRAKTGALMGSAAACGALLGGAPEAAQEAFLLFGEELGIAFQVHDDILGLWGNPEATGKPVGKDLWSGKKGYPVVYALAQACDADREFLGQIQSGHLSAARVSRFLDILERTGARQEGQQAVEEYRLRALARLDDLALTAQGRRELEEFTLYLVSA
ncbi:MAG TPA: polyprenyl synthetase family protein, partial [Dehalococcoidia bacterium]|nr:polyprenyl synthetase family protein [Dehalococcoidia bacterium]